MRLLVDACLPPWLADTIRPVAALDGVQVDYLPALYGRGVKDVDWLAMASEAGGATFITLDRHIRRRPTEVAALLASRCVGIVLLPQWQAADPHDRAAALLRRWPHIRDCLAMTPPAWVEFTWAHQERTPKPWRGLEKLR